MNRLFTRCRLTVEGLANCNNNNLLLYMVTSVLFSNVGQGWDAVEVARSQQTCIISDSEMPSSVDALMANHSVEL
jgi:hypothetical protein